MFIRSEGMAIPRSSNAGDNPGACRDVADASGNVGRQIRLYNGGAALVVGQIMKIKWAGATSGDPQVTAVVSGSAAIDRIVVAAEAVASGAWGWFWFEGNCQALVEGTTDVAVGNSLLVKVSVSTTGLVQDQTTALTVNTVAFAQAAQTANSNVLTAINLIGERATLTQ